MKIKLVPVYDGGLGRMIYEAVPVKRRSPLELDIHEILQRKVQEMPHSNPPKRRKKS